MKIAYLIYGTFNSGGMERVLCNKANWLVTHGFQVTIITSDQQGRESFFEFSDKIKMVDLEVNFTASQELGIVKKTINYLKKQKLYRKRLSALLLANQFDVTISMFGAEVHWLPKLRDKSKKVAEIHFSKYFREQQDRGGLWKLSDTIRSYQDNKAIKKYDSFVVLTNEDKSYWGENENIEVIHNSLPFVSVNTAELDNKRVISIGRLTYQKGFDMLLNSWAIVAKKHPDWSLDIFGGGDELKQRQEQAQRLGIGEKVNFFAPTQNVQQELLNSSIYALSSRYEGLPMVLIEAMSCGVPAVAFECKCGPKDAIKNNVNGILVEQNNVQQLADGICTLIENSDLRKKMGGNAANSSREQFDEQSIMNLWVDLFNKITKR